MRGYLSMLGTSSGKVPVDPRVELFRDPEDSQEVKVRYEDTVRGLGVSDVTVSREKNGTAPVVLLAHDRCIEVRNKANSNGVTVRTKNSETELEEGRVKRVQRDASIEIGYQAQLELTVEQEAQVEVKGGDYVAGNKVDKSTRIEDSVVNRSDVGSGSGSANNNRTDGGPNGVEVNDSVVNRSNVGDETPASGPAASDDKEDTRDFCQTHQRTYTGEMCPECTTDRQAYEEATDETERPISRELKFCIYCGAELPKQSRVCSDCGESL